MRSNKYFFCRLDEETRWDLYEKSNIVSIGWSTIDNSHLKNETGWGKFRESLKTSLAGNAWAQNQSNNYWGNVAGSVWRFIHEIKVGDFLLIPCPGSVDVCKVAKEAYFDTSGMISDSAWRLVVEPIKKGVPRNYASNSLQKRLKGYQTCLDISDLANQVDDLLNRNRPINFAESVLGQARKPMVNALLESVNDRGFERLVKQLFEAAGASRCNLLAKNDFRPGDVDIEAFFDLNIVGPSSEIKVGIQVKQHNGTTGSWGVQQLVDRKEVEGYDRLYLITTAENISEDAMEIAALEGVTIITKDDLVSWMLGVGVNRFTA
jgi:restriction system protein